MLLFMTKPEACLLISASLITQKGYAATLPIVFLHCRCGPPSTGVGSHGVQALDASCQANGPKVL